MKMNRPVKLKRFSQIAFLTAILSTITFTTFGYEPSNTAKVEPKLKTEVVPKYPLKAARGGLEGWVELKYSINPDGTVSDVDIMNSKPRVIFDKEAKRALNKWHYHPSYVNGQAVKLENRTVKLSFTLNRK